MMTETTVFPALWSSVMFSTQSHTSHFHAICLFTRLFPHICRTCSVAHCDAVVSRSFICLYLPIYTSLFTHLPHLQRHPVQCRGIALQAESQAPRPRGGSAHDCVARRMRGALPRLRTVQQQLPEIGAAQHACVSVCVCV